MSPDLLAENRRLKEELDAAQQYKAELVQQLGYVRDYLNDLLADLSTPVPADAPVSCRSGEHLQVAEIPGKCALCGVEVADGDRPNRPSGP